MASSSDAIFGVTCSIITIPTGATNAILVSAGNFVKSTLFKYASGGSISIFGTMLGINGPTFTGTSLVAGFSSGYLLGTSEVITFGGPAQFYVAATGSTALAYLMQGLDSSAPSFLNYG